MIWKWNYQLANYWDCCEKKGHLSFPLTLWYCGPQHLVWVKRAPFCFSLPVQEEPVGPWACLLSQPMVMERKMCPKPALLPSSSCRSLACGFWCSTLGTWTWKGGWPWRPRNMSPDTPQRERASAQSLSLRLGGAKPLWRRIYASPAAPPPDSRSLSLTPCQNVYSASTVCQKQWQAAPKQDLLSVSCATRPCSRCHVCLFMWLSRHLRLSVKELKHK